MHLGMARRALIVAAALAVPIAVCRPAVAHAGGQQSLLERYQPVTVMDGAEQFAPTTVGSFVADATLETQTSAGVWETVDATPALGTLPTHPTQACIDQGLSPCYRLNQPDCSPFDGPAGLACYHDAWQSPAPASVVYGRQIKHGTATVLQYWYFSYDDLYSYNYPPDDLFWQAHEGDWEMSPLSCGGDQAVSVGYSQHCAGERRAWADVERWPGTSHPVVYVATARTPTCSPPVSIHRGGCIPPEAIAVLKRRTDCRCRTTTLIPAAVSDGPGGLAGVTPRRSGRSRLAHPGGSASTARGERRRCSTHPHRSARSRRGSRRSRRRVSGGTRCGTLHSWPRTPTTAPWGRAVIGLGPKRGQPPAANDSGGKADQSLIRHGYGADCGG